MGNFMSDGQTAPVKDYTPDKEIIVDVINKRTLGREIIRLCGNEGNDDNPEKASLRRLLQGCITKLENEPEHIWRDAELRVFSNEGNEYCFKSGKGKNRLVAMYDENDELYIHKKK